MAKKSVGELLVRDEKISLKQLVEAKELHQTEGGNLAGVLVKLGYIDSSEVTEYIAKQYNIQTIDLSHFEIDKDVISLIPKEICKRDNVVPVMKSIGTLVVACADPSNLTIRDDLHFITQMKVELVVTSEEQIQKAITDFYDTSNIKSIISDLENTDNESTGVAKNVIVDSDENEDDPLIKFVNVMMNEAIKKGASDIHIEPYEKKFRIRFRIDGMLIESIHAPQGVVGSIVNRVKIISGLDISEKRKPQDGRIKIRGEKGEEMEFRVSTVPGMTGEKIVLRLLDKSGLNKPMEELGFLSDDLVKFKEAISKPVGIVLVTGPTGSGKSTTVYSALQEINKPDINLCTAEDPVEMNIEGINHVQVNAAIDLNFSKILRAFLRQDPDVIFVGEIRDLETADVAFKAASTGHLVISTLHTNDAPLTIARLTEIGVPPYLVGSIVSLILAQRLIGRVCESCKVADIASSAVFEQLDVPEDEQGDYNLFKGEGCNLCNGTGIKGRVAIHELMEITPKLQDAITRQVSSMELRKVAVENGMRSLRKSALIKLKEGLTSVAQVLSSTEKD